MLMVTERVAVEHYLGAFFDTFLDAREFFQV